MKLDKETTIQELKDVLQNFKEERDWGEFHNPKDLAEAIVVEAGELVELFMWQHAKDVAEKIQTDQEFRTEVEEELADIINYCLSFSAATGIDIATAVREKVAKNAKKYPVEKSRGVATKYTKL